MSMGNERGREWRIYKKHFYIKKRIINDLRANYTNYLGTDINSVYRLHTLWYHFLGSMEYRKYKSNSWSSSYNYRFGKKRFKHQYAINSYMYINASTRQSESGKTRKIIQDAGII
jgi:hypothetical protein